MYEMIYFFFLPFIVCNKKDVTVSREGNIKTIEILQPNKIYFSTFSLLVDVFE